MGFDSNQSYTYQIKKYKSGKPFVTIIIILIVILFFVFRGSILKLLPKFPSKQQEAQQHTQQSQQQIKIRQIDSPENISKAFIDAMQSNDYDSILTYIDFDAMVLFDSTNQDIARFTELYNNIDNYSDYERQVFSETAGYTKNYIKSTLERISGENTKFEINNVETDIIQENSDMNKVTLKIQIKKDQTKRNEEMIFYTIKNHENYRIIKFDGKSYF